MHPKDRAQMIAYMLRPGIKDKVKFASDIARPDPKPRVKEIKLFNEFNKRNPKADGGRIKFDDGSKLKGKNKGTTKAFYDESTGHIYPRKNRFGTFYSDTPVGGSRRNIIPDDIGKKILKEYEDGAGTIKLGEKYGFGKDTINRYVKKFNPKLLRDSPPKVNQYDFDYSVIDEIREDAKNMSRKQILKKYENKISDTKLDRLVKAGEIKFGVVEEAGRPRVPPGSIPEGTVKRTNRIRNSQGFAISGTQAKNFHHIFPIGGLVDLSPKDVMILDKNINERLGGFNLKLNDIADEIGSMDLSSPDALKKLNDLNAESKQIVDNAKAGLPKRLKNIIGYVEYNPVFDSNGTIVELSQVRKGVDKTPSQLAKFGDKKFKNFSTKERQNFKKEVLRVAKETEKRGKEAGFIDLGLFGDIGRGAGSLLKTVPTPLGTGILTAGFGVDPTSGLDRATLATEAALAPQLVQQSAKFSPAVQRVLNLGLSPQLALRAARIASPLGIASLAAEGLYQAGKFSRDRIRELQAMSPEQRQQLRAEQSALAFEGARDGGLIGKKSGPPPISGPTPHGDEGLPGIFKRAKKG